MDNIFKKEMNISSSYLRTLNIARTYCILKKIPFNKEYYNTIRSLNNKIIKTDDYIIELNDLLYSCYLVFFDLKEKNTKIKDTTFIKYIKDFENILDTKIELPFNR